MYGIEATPSLLRELRAAQPAGIRLLRRNIETPDQVRVLASALRKELGDSIEIAVRQEGGAVTPFVRGVTHLPGLAAVAGVGSAVVARDGGRARGDERGERRVEREKDNV